MTITLAAVSATNVFTRLFESRDNKFDDAAKFVTLRHAESVAFVVMASRLRNAIPLVQMGSRGLRNARLMTCIGGQVSTTALVYPRYLLPSCSGG